MSEWKLQKVRKLPDGRWQVIRSDGAMLSLTADDWRDALDWIEGMIEDELIAEGSTEHNGG